MNVSCAVPEEVLHISDIASPFPYLRSTVDLQSVVDVGVKMTRIGNSDRARNYLVANGHLVPFGWTTAWLQRECVVIQRYAYQTFDPHVPNRPMSSQTMSNQSFRPRDLSHPAAWERSVLGLPVPEVVFAAPATAYLQSVTEV